MAVRVRLFAAAREAAGEAETTVPAGDVDRVLASLREQYGDRFAAVLGVATILVDGSHVDPGSDVPVPDGAEVAILPPFSGG